VGRSSPSLNKALLFGRGAVCIPLMSWLLQNSELPYEWNFLAPVAALSVAAGFIEAGAIRRIGRQRWIGYWLPAVWVCSLPLSPQASFELLNVLERHPWLRAVPLRTRRSAVDTGFGGHFVAVVRSLAR